MLKDMRRLHPRGAANRGICVDVDGAMLGPNCVLVSRSAGGYRSLTYSDAEFTQKIAFGPSSDPSWLYDQCHRIADALNRGEVALAQIYGLHIPIDDLD